MSISQALSILRRLGSRRPSFASAASLRRQYASDSSSSRGNIHSGVACWKDNLGWIMGIFLSGQAVYFAGSSENCVYADDASGDGLVTQDDKEQTYVAGLRRIEDGSVISNMHTAKWRIYTDNGRDLFRKGKLDEAEKYFQAALQEAKEGFGPNDPHVASSCNNLAELYRVRKEFEKAEPLYLQAVSILEDSYGPEDIRVGAALHNLGQFYIAQRELEQARNCYERALKIKGRVLGYGHSDYAETMYHLGVVLNLQGKEKEAEDLIQESIRIMEEAGLRESARNIRRMKHLSQILVNSNRLAQAENLQRKILHILEISKGWNSLDTVIAAEGLALTLQSLGNLVEAKELLERCLSVRQKILPQDHIQISVNLLHLARTRLLNTNHLKKAKISEVISELDQAKHLLDKSISVMQDKSKIHAGSRENIADLNDSNLLRETFETLFRIAKANVGLIGEKLENSRTNHLPVESDKNQNAAVTILIQSLDAISLLQVRKQELLETGGYSEYPFEVELALLDCILLFKEPNTRTLILGASDIKAEYLSCMKHLLDLLGPSKNKLQVPDELIDEAQHIEAELLQPTRHRK